MPAGPRFGCWKVAATKFPCRARGSRSSQRAEVLVRRTAVTHWSSRRHAANARACTGSVGSKVSSRSEEHTSELQSLMRISYAVFCLKKKNTAHTGNALITTAEQIEQQPSLLCVQGQK